MAPASEKKAFKYARTPDPDPVCDSGVFCYGPMLDKIQMASIYPDSKTFVDKKLKYPPGKIIKKFEQLIKNGDKLSVEQIRQFVDENFDEEGQELELWTPEDWTAQPKFIKELKSGQLRGLAKRINKLLKDLSRRIKDEVRDNPQLYSIIYVPNGFVVPGGRFREFYYWDTYWIVKALLCFDMTTTVRGIIENFMHMVKTLGLVPNGGRIYYTKRSQPPFLTLMVMEYMNKTADVEWLRKNISILEDELQFFEEKRSLQVEKDGLEHKMFVFGTGGAGPRPESYREDVELAEEHFSTEEDKEEFYYHMKAGAETGWDYSTRWMVDPNGENKGGLKYVKSHYIVPVDLNGLMYMNYANMSEFYALLGDPVKAEGHANKANILKEAIKKVLWHEKDQMWYDFDLINETPRRYFYPSNLFPLWAECYDASEKESVAKSACKYLKDTGAIYCKGGLPTSFEDSGQQWDFPNAWPPLQHILVAGLLKTKWPEAERMALCVARRYTNGAIFSCPEGAEVCNMFEKYDANAQGSAGGGGEYEVQTGFGWTNGVVIEFMNLFGDRLLAEDDLEAEFEPKKSSKGELELNSVFDMGQGKARLVKKTRNLIMAAKLARQASLASAAAQLRREESGESNVGQLDGHIDEDDDDGNEAAAAGEADAANNDRAKRPSMKVDEENSRKLIAFFESKK